MKKTILLSVIVLFGVCSLSFSGNYYIRMSENSSHWSNIHQDATHEVVDFYVGEDFAAVLNSFATGDEIWVAKGTYTISGTIWPKNGSKIIGGFAGNESTLAERQLSDLDGNGMVEPWEFTNATEIVSANVTKDFRAISYFYATDAIIDGITVKGIEISSTQTQIIMIPVSATGCELKNSTVKDCTISYAAAAIRGTVGVYNGIIRNCLIQGNTIESTTTGGAVFGGGIALYGGVGGSSSPQAIGCVIRGNLTKHSVVGNNRAGGVVMYSGDASSYPKLINCLVYNNETQGQGGGIYIAKAASALPEVINCTVVNNKAASTGGGIILTNNGKFNNSIVWGNMHYGSTTPGPNDIIYAEVGSVSDYLAFGIFEETVTDALPEYTNKILLTSGKTASNNTDSTVNILAPKFVNPTTFFGLPTDVAQKSAMEHANFKLKVGSPCLDFASNSLLSDLTITTDLMGGNRFVNTTADLGAYEGAVEGTGVKDMKFEYGIYGANEHIVLSGLPLGQMLTIYNFAGQIVKNMKINDSNISLKISNGFYLVRVANQVTKVIVK